jgi:hypothetical protein
MPQPSRASNASLRGSTREGEAMPCVERSERPPERGSRASNASLRGSTREGEAMQ